MLALLRNIKIRSYQFRTYIVSSGDEFSAQKAVEFEDMLHNTWASETEKLECGQYRVMEVHRARRIHQSLRTTPWTSMKCLWDCMNILQPSDGFPLWPDLIITNGPGTGVIVVLAAVLLKYAGLRGSHGKLRTIYVESWARVKGLSLSGKILLRMVDRFLVQWASLQRVGRRAEYRGVLV